MPIGGGAGIETFLELTDTPDSYASQTLKLARVNAGETALEFVATSALTGINADTLDGIDSTGFALASHTHTASQVTNFNTSVIALLTDANIPNTITLDNITQITTRSHTSLSDIGTNTHAQIDTHIANASIHYTDEQVDDRVAALLQAAHGISWTYVDGSGTLTPVVGSFTIGTGAAGVDYTLTFNGETSDGVITWMEDEDQFRFADVTSFYRNDASTSPNAYIEQDSTGDACLSWLLTAGQEYRSYIDNSDSDSWKVDDQTGTDTFMKYDPSTGTFNLGVIGDGTIGDGTERTWKPQTHLKVNWGSSAFNFNEGWFNELHVQQTTTNLTTATVPTDAELDSAFGTPASLGRGFIATLDENSADTDVFIVFTSDASWYWIKGTKAT